MKHNLCKYQKQQYENKSIFNDTITILQKVKDKTSEEKKRLVIEWREFQSPVPRKDLSVNIIDDCDPLYLYSLLVTHEDYQFLKTDQSLVVDFNGFPNQLVELLNNAESSFDTNSSRYMVQFELCPENQTNYDALFSIKEITKFKHLTHLALKFHKSDDVEIKYHLSDQIGDFKAEIEMLKNKLCLTETTLSKDLQATKALLEVKTSECLKLQEEIKEVTSNLSSKYAKDVSAEKDKVLQTQIELSCKLEKDKSELTEKFTRQVNQLEARLGGSEAQNKDLTDKKYRLEMSIKDLQGRLSLLEEEVTSLRQEAINLKRHNLTLDEDNNMKERELHKLQTEGAVLQHKCRDLDRNVKQQEDILESLRRDKKQQDEQVQLLIDTIGKKDSSLKSVGQELLKANEIIQKLQEQTKLLHGKLKLRSRVSSEQEKLIQDKDKQLSELKMTLQEVRQSVKSKEEELVSLKSQLEDGASKVVSLEKIVKANENLISWLNRQLNEREVLVSHRGHNSQPHGASSYKSPSDKMVHSTPVIRGASNPMASAGSSIQSKSRDLQLISKDDVAKMGLDEKYLLPDNSVVGAADVAREYGSKQGQERSKLPTAVGRPTSGVTLRGFTQKPPIKSFTPELIFTPPLAANYFPN